MTRGAECGQKMDEKNPDIPSIRKTTIEECKRKCGSYSKRQCAGFVVEDNRCHFRTNIDGSLLEEDAEKDCYRRKGPEYKPEADKTCNVMSGDPSVGLRPLARGCELFFNLFV